MKILYAPSGRSFSDVLHRNVACGFDSMVLESLVGIDGAEVVYLPHLKTDREIVESLMDTLKGSVALAKVAPKRIDIAISDVSNLVLQYALWTRNPSLLCLFGFHSVSFPQNDRYFSLLESCTIPIYSLQELKDAIINYREIKKQKAYKIQKVLEGEAI